MVVCEFLFEYNKGTPSMIGGSSSGVTTQGQVQVHRLYPPLTEAVIPSFTHIIYRTSESFYFSERFKITIVQLQLIFGFWTERYSKYFYKSYRKMAKPNGISGLFGILKCYMSNCL